ncbi:MAG: hypothetical protein H6807_07870 [Planctomycetes bacterium]|nr:hypothetical protein [Planctomycetota bacterium]
MRADRRTSWWLMLALPIALGIGTRLPFLDSPFRSDDYHIIRSSGPWLAELGRRVRHLDVTEAITSTHRGNFRPVTWTIHTAELLLGSRPESRDFHLVSLLIHLITVVASFLVGRRLAGPGAGLVAATLVATTASGLQAFSWISGRSDLLLGAFGMTAVLLALHRGLVPALGSGLCAALAVGSKASGLALLPIPLLIVLGSNRHRRRAALLLHALPIATMLLLRYFWLGTFLPWYYMRGAGDRPAMPGEPRVIADMTATLLMPASREPGFQPWTMDLLGDWSRLVVVLVVGLPLVLALLRSRRRGPLFTTIAALVLVSLPLATVWTGVGDGLDQNRNFLLPQLALALASGLASASLLASGRLLRRVAIVAIAAQVALSLDCWNAYRRVDERVANLVTARIKGASAIVDGLDPGEILVAEDRQASFAGQLLLESALADVFRRPFRAEDRQVEHVTAFSALRYELERSPEAVAFCRWSEDESTFRIEHRLPAVPAAPALRPAERTSGSGLRFVGDGPLPGRAGLALLLPVGVGPAVELRLRAIGDGRGHELSRHLPARTTAGAIVLLDLPIGLAVAERFESLELDGDLGKGLLTAAPRLVPRLRVDPEARGSWSPEGFRIDRPWSDDLARVVIETSLPDLPDRRPVRIVLEWWPEDQERDAAGHLVLRSGRLRGSEPPIEGSALEAQLAAAGDHDFVWRIETCSRAGRRRASPWFWSAFSRARD